MNYYIPTAFDFDPNERGHFGIFGGRYIDEEVWYWSRRVSYYYNKRVIIKPSKA